MTRISLKIFTPTLMALTLITHAVLTLPNVALGEIVRPEVATTAAAINDCIGSKTYKIKLTTDVQKEGLALWKKNRNEGPYPLPPTFEYVVNATVGQRAETWTCKIQKQKSGKWKVIDSLLHGYEAELFD